MQLRFLLPVLSVLEIPASCGLASLVKGRRKSAVRQVAMLLAFAGILGSLALTLLILQVSRLNYPGGEALQALHQLQQHSKGKSFS